MFKLIPVLLIVPLLCFCKKKEEKKPEPPPVVNPTPHNTMTAKVNGADWTVKGNLTATASIEQSGGGSPKQFLFFGRSGSSTFIHSIFLYTQFAQGVVDLRTGPGCSAIYFDTDGDAHYVNSGTMTITVMDTSHVKSPHCDRFKASFSFVTDSSKGTRYMIEQGQIDFEVP